MIHLENADLHSVQNILRTCGGFAWWYVDARDSDGNGLVLIWSFGLPFLAGSRSPGVPAERPALNLCLYRQGRPAFYLLTEYEPGLSDVSCAGGSGRMAESSFQVVREAGEVRLDCQLDLAIPRSPERLRGSVRLRGPALQSGQTGADGFSGDHAWCPLSLAAHVEARFSFCGEELRVVGSGYFDSNFSRVPLHEQGIKRWHWGRCALSDGRTLVYYQITPKGSGSSQGLGPKPQLHLVAQDRAGVCRTLDETLIWREPKRGTYGLVAPRRMHVDLEGESLELSLEGPLDDGPFYQRFLLDAAGARGTRGHGFAEVVEPDLVDQAWQRPFIRMRIHRPRGENSFWLPLFSGSRRGRFRRLLGLRSVAP